MHNILLLEDNFSVSRSILEALPNYLYQTRVARTVGQAYQQLSSYRYDLIVLDRNLPDGDGIEVAEYLYQSQRDMPILVLSEKSSTPDRIWGLKKGADDYLPKPFSHEELLLRMEKLLTKTKHIAAAALQVKGLTVFPSEGVVIVDQEKVSLRRKEIEILSFLMRHKNSIVTRELLIENIWPNEEMPTYATIDVYIRRIRILLGKKHDLIKTVRGYGYILKEEK
jgi:DNA-binding response OmpR family regulator